MHNVESVEKLKSGFVEKATYVNSDERPIPRVVENVEWGRYVWG